jgi:hypothetical protein
MATHNQTPRKGKRRSHQNHHNQNHNNHIHNNNNALGIQQGQATDYETDYPIDIDAPPMTRTNEELNHSVLRRYYPHTLHILSTASYAVLYQFSPDASTWVKLEIEGTLFISQLTASDIGAKRFNVVILNRRGVDNFEQELRSSEDVEVTSEYVILKGELAGEDVVYGLWIFAEPGASTAGAREENAGVIERCAKEAEESSRIAMRKLVESQQHVGGSNGYAAEQEDTEGELDAESVPMGRQLSLRELFGKQRELDAGFTVKHHESPKFASAQPVLPSIEQKIEQPQEKAPTPMFFTNPDTDFFRSGPKFTPQQDEPMVTTPVPIPGVASGNPLLALLRGNG